jgi:hypothetical protein
VSTLFAMGSVSDPLSLYADPDPAFLMNKDLDPNPSLELFKKLQSGKILF